MADTNLQLLPERKQKIKVSVPGENRLINLSLLLLFIVGGIYLGLYLYDNSIITSIHEMDNNLKALEDKRDKGTEEKLLTTNKKITLVVPLLNSQISWSQGLNKLQSLSQPQIQFKTINGNVSEKKIVFKAEAPNYTVVAHQIASFLEEKSIKDIALDRVITNPSGRIEFNMKLIYDPAKFLAKPKS